MTSSSQTTPRTNFWAGWTAFGAILIIIAGVFNAIQGLAAVFADNIFVKGSKGGALVLDVTQWGWVHVILGLVLVVVGLGLVQGRLWARILGVAVIMVNMITQMAMLPSYPFWSIIIITLDAVVLWAICVHGSETLEEV
jgi:hypothetical protein